MLRWSLPAVVFVSLTGCAAAPEPAVPEAEEPVVSEAIEAKEAVLAVKADAPPPEEEPKELPTPCAGEGDICTPPAKFVDRLCMRTTPSLALTMFHKDSPWTRAYVRGNMEAWYANGRSRPRQLSYGEEVIIVANRANSGSGIQVSGSGSYDVYRWDGSCVSLMSDEVTLRRVGAPNEAVIEWKRLDDGLRANLGQDKHIAHRNDRRLEACKGSDNGRCERAEKALSQMIAHYVRQGGELPEPTELP